MQARTDSCDTAVNTKGSINNFNSTCLIQSRVEVVLARLHTLCARGGMPCYLLQYSATEGLDMLRSSGNLKLTGAGVGEVKKGSNVKHLKLYSTIQCKCNTVQVCTVKLDIS